MVSGGPPLYTGRGHLLVGHFYLTVVDGPPLQELTEYGIDIPSAMVARMGFLYGVDVVIQCVVAVEVLCSEDEDWLVSGSSVLLPSVLMAMYFFTVSLSVRG